MSKGPKWLAVRSLNDGNTTVIIPVDFIMSFGALFKKSEVIQEVVEEKGKTVLRLKSHETVAMDHSLNDIVVALGADVEVAFVGHLEIKTEPDRAAVIMPEASQVISAVSKK